MRPQRLLICFLLTAACLTCVSEAQHCYRQSNEHVWGNIFVKPMTDSTCFGQWYGTVLYYNYRTGDTLFSFKTKEFYPYARVGHAEISDILMYDSVLVISLEKGAVYRILKVDFRGVVTELPSGLDQIPMLKNSGKSYGFRQQKMTIVNDSIFLISNILSVFSFHLSSDIITRVDSVRIHGAWSAVDVYKNTIIVIDEEARVVRSYNVDAEGRVDDSTFFGIDHNITLYDVYLRHGNIYAADGTELRVLVGTPTGFNISHISVKDMSFGLRQPLFGKENIILVGWSNDEIWIYDRNLNLLCNQSPVDSPGAGASGIYGEKVFTANALGIKVWIPDSSTMSASSAPVGYRQAGIEIWPNPSSGGMITVRCEEPTTDIQLADASGRLVYRAALPGAGVTSIPTAWLPTGVYFVSATTAHGMARERVVILRTTY